jgi:hypothetical protein
MPGVQMDGSGLKPRFLLGFVIMDVEFYQQKFHQFVC